jgi:hypothetical protein
MPTYSQPSAAAGASRTGSTHQSSLQPCSATTVRLRDSRPAKVAYQDASSDPPNPTSRPANLAVESCQSGGSIVTEQLRNSVIDGKLPGQDQGNGNSCDLDIDIDFDDSVLFCNDDRDSIDGPYTTDGNPLSRQSGGSERVGGGYVSAIRDGDLVHPLIVWGVEPDTANHLAQRYDEDRILRQLKWMKYQSARKPSAFLIIAIEQNYTQPHGMTREEVDEVETLIAERKFRMPPHMQTNPVPGRDEPEPVEPKDTHAPSCDEPTCAGCVPF